MLTALAQFIQVSTDDPKLVQIVSRLQDVFRTIADRQILDGRLSDSISLTSGSVNKVPHKLGKPVNGYVVVKKSANAVIWDSESTNTDKRNFLNLNTSANCAVTLWIF